MKRLYDNIIAEHITTERQMLFLAGPRQVGKTTLSQHAKKLSKRYCYLNWDIQSDRQNIIAGPKSLGKLLGLERPSTQKAIVVFDEIHKYGKWKTFLKGFFDLYEKDVKIIVTGSSRLDVYQKGGDSLMGRYFLYRIFPISVGELAHLEPIESPVFSQKKVSQEKIDALLKFGGFPEPFLRQNKAFHTRWLNLRHKQLFQEDVRDLTQVQEIAQIELLTTLLREQSGQLLNYSNLAKKVNVSTGTIKRWLTTLESFYAIFLLRPYTQNVARSLMKEPKVYFTDWSTVKDPGARLENLIATHLLKAVSGWNDMGLGSYNLHFIRDKDKREVDFLVTEDGRPWFLVEVKKSSNHSISKSLHHFHEKLKTKHAFQVVFDGAFENIDAFSYEKPIVVPYQTLLSQLL